MDKKPSRFLTRLRSMPLADRITSLSVIVLALAIIGLVVSQIFVQWDHSMHLIEFLSGSVMLLQARLFWKTNRFTAIFSLCAAGIIFTCFAVLLFAK